LILFIVSLIVSSQVGKIVLIPAPLLAFPETRLEMFGSNMLIITKKPPIAAVLDNIGFPFPTLFPTSRTIIRVFLSKSR